MMIEQVRTAYKAETFRPFVIHLDDGRVIPVEHADFMMVTPSGRRLVVVQSEDSFNIIDLRSVRNVEPKSARKPPQQKRRP
jgi:hypothetical protein